MAVLFDKIGDDALRRVLEDFYDRVLGDPMIGFLFVGTSRQRLIDKEWEFAAKLLGADVAYTGKGIRAAHARHPILGGHFERRLQILRETLRDHDVDPEVCKTWLHHTQRLRHLVTADRGSECRHEAATATEAKEPGRRLPIIDD